MGFLIYPYSVSTTYANLSSFASTFGPNFENKCILGIRNLKHSGTDYGNYYLSNSTWGFYQIYTVETYTSPFLSGFFFCFGNGT